MGEHPLTDGSRLPDVQHPDSSQDARNRQDASRTDGHDARVEAHPPWCCLVGVEPTEERCTARLIGARQSLVEHDDRDTEDRDNYIESNSHRYDPTF